MQDTPAIPAERDAAGSTDPAWFTPPDDDEAAFARGLAHDLRAPLRAIDGFAAQLQSRTDAAGQVAQAQSPRPQLQRIRDAAARMGALVDGLHLHAQARHAALRRAPVDLSLLAEWAGTELQDAAQERVARIAVAGGLAAEGDEHWLKVALKALLRNAWTFSAPRDAVRIDVEGETAGEVLRLRVRDAGIGFDPAHGDKLFVPFQRLHSAAEGAGAGLGLATAWCVVRRHAGRMRVQGAPDAGCVVEMELPLRARFVD